MLNRWRRYRESEPVVTPKLLKWLLPLAALYVVTLFIASFTHVFVLEVAALVIGYAWALYLIVTYGWIAWVNRKSFRFWINVGIVFVGATLTAFAVTLIWRPE
jgi:hypothetical protein